MFTILRLATDISAICLSFILAYLLKFGNLSLSAIINFPLATYSNQMVLVLLVFLATFQIIGLYRTRRGFLIDVDEFLGVFSGVTLAWVLLIVLTFIRGEYEFSRYLLLLSWPLTFILLVTVRELILRIELFARKSGWGSRRALVIGDGELARELAERLKKHPSYGLLFVRFLESKDLTQLEEIVRQEKISNVFVADKKMSREKLVELASKCDDLNISFGAIPDVFQILTTSPAVEDIEGLPLISMQPSRFNYMNRYLKRSFDILLSLFGIILFSPIMLLIVPLIKIFSPGGPAVYAQERVGKKGKVFELYKFRTMIPDAEGKTGPVLATADDPRKTPLGKILRMTNLDELPQLFNILKGDMSFVGPRPELPIIVNEFKQMIPKYMERHKIRPGLAGWAQLHGGYSMPPEEKIKYDLFYIENWSLVMDIKIILKYIQIAFTFQRKN